MNFGRIWKGIKVAVRLLVGLNAAGVVKVKETPKIEAGVGTVDAEIERARKAE
jgi:hypothetical protein